MYFFVFQIKQTFSEDLMKLFSIKSLAKFYESVLKVISKLKLFNNILFK